MDQFDRAQLLDAYYRDQALAARKQTKNGPSALFCIDCGEEIPKQRREAVPGCERCRECQEEAERE
jgi:phage/conjugal plasmid C-4 type zinc finger TraR family protein